MVGDGLPPVVGDELLGQLLGRYSQTAAGVVAPLDADVGDAEQQRVLIGGDEAALGEQPLDVQEESDLFVWRRGG
jgi:hypothetical protein